MKTKATFYHAGCAVCVSAEESIANSLDAERYEIEVVHLGDHKDQIPAAEAAGVQSVPALVMNGQPFHINFGASMADVKGL